MTTYVVRSATAIAAKIPTSVGRRTERTIYQFYAVSFVPFVVLAVTYLCGLVIGSPHASAHRRMVGSAAVGSYLVLTVLIFTWFLPIYTAQVVNYQTWWVHMWLPSWV